MKQFKLLFALLIVTSMTFFQSCSDSDDSNNGEAAGAFQVDFDGQTYVADVVSATITDNNLNITGLRGANGENIVLTIFGTSVGTYQLGVVSNQTQVNGAAYIEPNNTGSGVFVAQTDGIESQGELIITAIDEVNLTMTGTFSFTGYNPNTDEVKEFTNGIFNQITYSDGLVSVGDNTFFANVDGTEFVEDLVAGTSLNTGGMSTIAISATKNSNETIGLYFDADVAPGTYDFGGFGGTPLAQYNLSSSEFTIGDGTFTISSHDIENKRIIGTFEFTASDPFGGSSTTYEITEGSFDVTYF
ncbi:DUF6252 family protein [Psychroserpens luteus]|uniref:DUF6252 family protein n=1 Tax=Psychroserpens luteus TaxID=1434066 RepID=A0ABW5ZRV3_9FLAO|nr:DUF6252 family protein [Psychroserpens luteus]